MAALSARDVAEYRDVRLSTGLKTQTVRHDLPLLSRAIKQGMMEWGIALPAGNPMLNVRMPAPSKPRDRRLIGDEEARLLEACNDACNHWLLPVVRFAMETAMRAGEMLETFGTADPQTGVRPQMTTDLLWGNVDLDKRTALLPHTKNNEGTYGPIIQHCRRSAGRIAPLHRWSRIWYNLRGHSLGLCARLQARGH